MPNKLEDLECLEVSFKIPFEKIILKSTLLKERQVVRLLDCWKL